MNALRTLLLAAGCGTWLAACASAPPATGAAPAAGTGSIARAPVTGLEGSSWRLVQIVLADGATRAAIERSRYTIGFGAQGVLNVRFDCNRGRGSWQSTGPNNLEFGPLSLTRALCPVGSLHDELVRQWPLVRSFVIRDGRLVLSMQAGGTIEFEPAP